MWLSILGMYNNDDTIFDGFNTPEGIIKDDVVDNILIECSELEIVYPEPAILKRAIEIWSNSNQIEWNKLYKTMTVEYNPIWNVDANIKDTEIIKGNANSTDNRDITNTGSGSDIKSVKGFNSNSWAEAEKNDVKSTNKTDDDLTHAEETNTERSYTQRRTGNIGVTATQDLIQKEREIAVFNMIQYITESFKERFCVMVY